MKKFNAVDFIKREVMGICVNNFEIYDGIADIVNFWELHRGADGCEDIYDMRKYDDRAAFIKRYGADAIEKYVEFADHNGELCNYCYMIGGANFPEPKRIKWSEMITIIKDEFDLEFFKELLSDKYNYGGQMEQILSRWFDIEGIKDYIKENKKWYFCLINTIEYDGENRSVQVVEINWEDFDNDNILGWELDEEYTIKGTDKQKFISEMEVGDMLEGGFPYVGSYIMRIG